MKESTCPKEHTGKIIALREAGMSVQDIAAKVGCPENDLKRLLKSITPLDCMLDTLPDYPAEMLKIPDRPCALTADWHAPYFSELWLRRLLAVCFSLGVRDLAIVGDFADLSWIARYIRKEQRGSLSQDVEIIYSTLKTLLNFFADVWWIYGNHEDRLVQKLGGQDMLQESAAAVSRAHDMGKLHTSDMSSMLLGTRWRLEHPKTFSRDGAKVAAEAASIYHKNVACGHGHHFGFKYDVSGKYLGIDLGGMFDANKQEYLFKTGITTLPQWTPGFWVYKNGKVLPFENSLTDWSVYGVD